MVKVSLIGTCDTKLEELLFLRDAIRRADAGVEVVLIDVGRHQTQHADITLSRNDLLKMTGNDQSVADLPRGEVIKKMAECATVAVQGFLERDEIQGIIAAGGSGGTSLAATVMRNALPIGFPKMIVSTVASGDTGPIVEETDITLMYSVVDIAGLNHVLRTVLNNAGAAIAAMARSYALRSETTSSKKRVGITMFGVTTPAVDAIRKHLESHYNIETYVFHATGHGGKAMERLVRDGSLDAVLDLTTTEICDHLTGGVMSAGPNRLQAASEAGIVNIVSVGATDMSNFGPKATVPQQYKHRKLYEHNSVVTLMRTSEDEAHEVGTFIAAQLRAYAKKPEFVEVWLPMGGVSMISTSDGPFADEKADAALFGAIKKGLAGSGIKTIEDKRDINDPNFARDIAEALAKQMAISQ
ncbi:hypothetical protein K458DRAFT_73785 [Lentithecium fluviatile CBS 122367]|uniref:Uncharacterized protein n=1 Tax=Lentithecium fluviatile CBS 122367 TaxID=1168545 RepID=A0A6G1IVX1_9PLEO|nr:hypothetical protein K458DRAFT_73785 [Lentithecium fluviatile CBS 122367]